MPRPTAPYRTFALRRFGGLFTEADARALPPGSSPILQDCDFVVGQVTVRPGLTSQATFSGATPSNGWKGLGQALLGNGSLLTFTMDGIGQLWFENAATPGAFTILCGPGSINPPTINTPNLLVLEANTRAYLFLSDFQQGTDQPRQWDGLELSRVSKCGPGVGPGVGTPSTGTDFGVTAWQFGQVLTITDAFWGTSITTTPGVGNNLYLLFAPNSVGNITQFNVGDYLYLAGMPNLGGGTNLNGTFQIASTGTFGVQEYVQVVVREANGVSAPSLSGVTVQRTKATVVLNVLQPSTPGAFSQGALVLLNSFLPTALNNQFTITVPSLANTPVNQTDNIAGVSRWAAELLHGNRFWWQASTNYVLGQQIVQQQTTTPTGPGTVWICIRQGITGATYPSWPGSPSSGTTVVDGAVIWSFVPNAQILMTTSSLSIPEFNVSQLAIDSAIPTVGHNGVEIRILTGGIAFGVVVEGGNATVGGGFTFEIEPAVWTLGHPELNPIFLSATGNVTGVGAQTGAKLPNSLPPPGPQQVVALGGVPGTVPKSAINRIISSSPIARALTLATGTIFDPPNVPGTMLPSALNDVAPGLRWAVCLFLTKTGHITPASPPTQFNPIGGYVQFINLPVGPPDVIARIIAFTEANAAIGGPYYYVAQDAYMSAQTIAVANITEATPNTASTVTAVPSKPAVTPLTIPATKISSTIVWDNTSSQSILLTMSDTVLVSSTNISADGQNYLRTRELGECVNAVQYSGRSFYMGERAKVDNFVNPTFDGGYVITPGLPAGWTAQNQVNALYTVGTSLTLPDSCFSLKITNNQSSGILNPTGTTLANMEAISQPAYQDAYHASIVLPNTQYGVRVVATAAATSGSLVVELYSPSLNISYTLTAAVGGLAAPAVEVTDVLNNALWTVVPTDLQLRVYATNLNAMGSITVDRIEVYDVKLPVYANRIGVSYANDPEGIDGVSGAIDITQWTSEPIRGIFRWLNNVVIATDSHTFMATDNGVTEPSGWNVTVATQRVGILGPKAWALGNEFALVADRNGVWTFDGGNHVKISQEIQKFWDQRYVPSQIFTWLENDMGEQRLYAGVPLVLPNPYMGGDQPTPPQPNIVLLCNYLNLLTGSQLADGDAVSVSMFTGGLLFRDNKRKWCPWTIPADSGVFIRRTDGSLPFWMTGANQEINQLGGSSDNGASIPQQYTTYAFNDENAAQAQGWGDLHKLYVYLTFTVEGTGGLLVTGYPETIQTQWPINNPVVHLVSTAQEDVNMPVNMRANRIFLRFATDISTNSNFTLKYLTMAATLDSKIPVTGR
ncbi:MAG: hypothetical protein ACREKE_07910 [bacterium]